jgi:hypothetical protein
MIKYSPQIGDRSNEGSTTYIVTKVEGDKLWFICEHLKDNALYPPQKRKFKQIKDGYSIKSCGLTVKFLEKRS